MAKADYSHMRVTVIDDDAVVVKVLGSVLTDYGFSAQVFEDPLKAIQHIKDNGTDIVISDICMAGCDGFEVLKQVKDIDPQCDVLFITAHSQIETAIRALREGAADYLEKPISPDSLCAALERTTRFRILTQQKDLLTHQVDALRTELTSVKRQQNLILGESDVMKKIAQDIVDVAASNATVLILGESGTGKELVANAIHQAGSRRDEPFLTLNCPSIPEDLFESEMFGHRRGAFTGAVETRGGYVEAARGGTLFLDEIGDLPLKSQAKILRLLEQKTYLPVGEHAERTADVRVIAATNQSLEELVANKKFREDLFYRLSVCTIAVPPLRKRKSDLPLLALYFTLHFAGEMGKNIHGLDQDTLQTLASYDFPGNVRELRNMIESSVIRCRHPGLLSQDDLPPFSLPTTEGADTQAWPMDTLRLEDVERRLYQEALNRTNNNVSAAARLLGLSRGKLRRRLGALGIAADGEEPE